MSGAGTIRRDDGQLLDIVVASYGRRGQPSADLDRCLATVRAHTTTPHRVLVEQSRSSAATNRNRALARSRAPIVCFLDDDAWVTPGWSETLVALLGIAPDVGMAGPKIKLTNGTIFAFGMGFQPPDRFGPVGYGSHDGPQFERVVEPFAIPSTCLVVTREALAAAGGFDEEYGGSQWEDLDFYLSLRRAGFRGLLSGRAVVFHANLFRCSQAAENRARFLAKWTHLVEPVWQSAPRGEG